MYQLIQNPGRGNRYLKDSKLISEQSVPLVWKRILANQDIFTGEPATHKRLINNVMIPLDDSSYYKETVGSITAKLKEEDNGSDQDTPERSPA